MEARLAGESKRVNIAWFRNDLRLSDNPMLAAAAADGAGILAVFILDDETKGHRKIGSAARWWLHHSLERLSDAIRAKGGVLLLRRGDPRTIIPELAEKARADSVYWSRRYCAAEQETDAGVKTALKATGVDAHSFNGSLLVQPWALKTSTDGYYRVFTPYWKALRASFSPSPHLSAPLRFSEWEIENENLEDWALKPSAPNWAKGFEPSWRPGEAGAHERLEAFIGKTLSDYAEDRDRPDLVDATSGLSPHLRWGEISPHSIWRTVRQAMERGTIPSKPAEKFLSEIAWRDFSYTLFHHNPDLARANYNSDFDNMPWREDAEGLEAWKRGRTGFPFIDAGMRQLWSTGWMHNRVRMVTASFLAKHLLIHWSHGEAWFWDTLLDADPASNPANWQWVAGSGADAAPYFRIFNPITQAAKFDPRAAYIRKWVPELADIPDRYIFEPWNAPPKFSIYEKNEDDSTYGTPILSHQAGRERALGAYEIMKQKRNAQ